MNNVHQEGSSILLVMIVMTITCMVCCTYWQSTIYISHIALERGTKCKKNQMTYALLQYGILYAKEQLDYMTTHTTASHKKEAVIASWPSRTSSYNAQVICDIRSGQEAHIDAYLRQQQQVIDHMSCKVQKQYHEKEAICVVTEFHHA